MVTHVEDLANFPAVVAVHKERASAVVDIRSVNEAKAKYAEKFNTAREALESAQAAYQGALDDYTRGKVDEKALSATLKEREAAERAHTLARDTVAAFEVRLTDLNAQLSRLQPQLNSAYSRGATSWLAEVRPELETRLLAAVEDFATASFVANEAVAPVQYAIEMLIERAIKPAIERSNRAKRRLESGVPQ